MTDLGLPVTAHDDEATQPGDPLSGSPYRTIRRLGAGGMGEVFLVRHRELEREFVAKVIRPRYAKDPQLVDRMRVEAQALGRLRHPNIVEVVDFRVSSDGRPFIVMEYLSGHSMARELSLRGVLPAPEAVAYARQMLLALQAAHELGVVHRDVKPENLFLAERRERPRILKVLDFGIARVLPGVSHQGPRPLMLPTESGTVVGTPRFVSPEGAMGNRVDHRADIYSAGLVLYAMLTGRGPFDHSPDPVSAHVNDPPPRPSEISAEPLPPELERTLLRALAKSPDDRFQTAAEFAVELARIADALQRPSGWLETLAYPTPRTPALSQPAIGEQLASAAPNAEVPSAVARGHSVATNASIARPPPSPAASLGPASELAEPARARNAPRTALFQILSFVVLVLAAAVLGVALVLLLRYLKTGSP